MRDEDEEAPENWEEIDVTENNINKNIVATDIKIVPATGKTTISQPKIIRTDLDNHTPYKPSIKILPRSQCTQTRERSQDGLKKDSVASLRERELRYIEARNRIFNTPKNTE